MVFFGVCDYLMPMTLMSHTHTHTQSFLLSTIDIICFATWED